MNALRHVIILIVRIFQGSVSSTQNYMKIYDAIDLLIFATVTMYLLAYCLVFKFLIETRRLQLYTD